MGIGPFTTYSPPGVTTQTVADPIVGQLLQGLRVPVLIGVGQETLTQTDYEIVRGSSSVADTPIFGEDAAGRWVVGGTSVNPTLGDQDGGRFQIKVRNYPIVDGFGIGKTTFDTSKVSVTVNGQQMVVAAVDGPNGLITLLTAPTASDLVSISYYFRRKDTRVTDNVSAQVTQTPAVLMAPKAESYVVTLGVTDKLLVLVNDSVVASSITLTSGTRTATQIANDINAAAVSGLTASVHVDAQGLNHVQLQAQGNVQVTNGTANAVLGFNPGDYTRRNKSFRVFNGPIVDGSDGGLTTTDTSKVVIMVSGVQVIATSVDGANRLVTLPFAPRPGSTVTIQYYFNTFQDTFDYLPNSNVVVPGNVGIAPGKKDYLNGPDYVIVNDKDQSKIQWGTSFQVVSGLKTGSVSFDGVQISGLLVDDRIFGMECQRFTDPFTNVVSTTKFVIPVKPTTGNGRDTPLGISLYQTITNGRIDLPTNRPDLVIVHVGRDFRDAVSRPAVTVTEVDSATNTFVLRTPVPSDHVAFATAWYNRIADDSYTLTVIAPGPSGVGTFGITSQLTGNAPLFSVKFGSKSALAQTVQWPSGVEILPDAFHFGGKPVSETVTVAFSNSLDPATHASFTSGGAEPYDIYAASKNFGGVVVDGGAPVTVDLSSGFKAQLLSQPVSSPGSMVFLSTDRLVLEVDGVIVDPIDVSAATTLTAVATAINSAIDSDVQSHPDGSGTFSSTSPNALASVLTYGSESVLRVRGRNVMTSTNGLESNVKVLAPTSPGETDAAAKVGLVSNQEAFGSFSAINQPASMIGAKTATFNITAGLNDSFMFNVDGVDFTTTLPAGATVSLSDVVNYVQAGYAASAPSADAATILANTIALANAVKADYNAHRVDVANLIHGAADSTNVVTAANASDLATLIVLINEIRTDYEAHRILTAGSVHGLADSVNVVVPPAASDLQSAVVLTYELKKAYNAHVAMSDSAGVLANAIALVNAIKADYNAHRILIAGSVHGAADTTNATTSADATDLPSLITLINELKGDYNAHRVLTAGSVHGAADSTNVATAANATNLITAVTLALDVQAKYNAHRILTAGSVHGAADTVNNTSAALVVVPVTGAVHGLADLINVSSASLFISELVAFSGLGINAGRLILKSRINTVNSYVAVSSSGTANDVLGFSPGASATYHQPRAADLAGALNASSGFSALALAYSILVPGLGGFLKLNSRTAGTGSTLSFTSVSSTAFIPDTGLGIVPGSSGDVGEAAQAGFSVTSSDVANGSSGFGIPGQTYTDARTGLRFTVLPASAGDYANGGSFTLLVGTTFTADASIPFRTIPGVEVSVYNTNGMNPGTTSVLTTYPRTGSEPQVGDVYYISYQYAKTDLSTTLFRDQKKIQQSLGPATPDYPLALAARLAMLNGAILVGLKQVSRVPGSSQASVTSYKAAIDEQRKPMSGNVLPDVITPIATDPQIFAYLNQHCVFMSAPRQEGERIAVVGTAAGTSPTGAQAIAKGLASELSVVVYPDSYVVSVQDDQGNLIERLVDGSYMAAAVAGSTCSPSVDVATPWTRRQIIGFNRPGRILDPTEANQVAVAGVCVIEQMDSGLRIRHGLTTLLDTVITRTPSVTLTIHFVQQQVRRTLDPHIGQKFAGTLLKSVERDLGGMFATLIDAQIVAKVAGIAATVDELDPTIMRTEAIYVPVFPLEYIVSLLRIRIRA